MWRSLSAVALTRYALALACLAAVAGCEADPAPLPVLAHHTQDSAGIVIAVNSGVPAEGERWSVDAEPLVSIGGADGPPPTMFAVVTTASRLSDGTIVVLENGASELRFFDSEGEHLRTVGGAGEGPGEFEYPAGSFVRLAGDTLLVDAGARHLVFGPTGDYVRQTRIDVLRHFSGKRSAPCAHFRVLPEGSLLACEVVSDEIPAVQGAPASRVIRVAPDGTEVVLGYYWDRLELLRERTWIASGGSPPFVAIAPNPDYSIEVWSLDGDLKRIIRRLDGRRAPTDREVRADIADLKETFGIDSDEEPPELVPAAFGMTVGINGDIWVRREPFVSIHDETVFDVFDGQGRFRGEVRFEGYFWLYEVGEDYVLGARLDELDVAHIQLHRLSRKGAMPDR